VLGLGEAEHYFASDIYALLRLTRRFIYLAEGDVLELRDASARIFDGGGVAVERPVRVSVVNLDAAERGTYRQQMLKEIFEQPQAVADTLESRVADDRVSPNVFGVGADTVPSC